MTLPRALHPATNAPGLTAAAGAIYAAATMLYNAHYHHGVLSTPVLVSGAAAIIALLTRFVVTPVADPVDGAGRPLVPDLTAPVPAAALGGAVLDTLRAEAGLPPLPPATGITVVPPQPIGVPQVIIEDAPVPDEEPRP